MLSFFQSTAGKFTRPDQIRPFPAQPVQTPGRLKDELLDIIKKNRLTTVYQPIIDLISGEVYAYEALCRIKGDTCFENIETLFQTARHNNLTPVLEKNCRQNALSSAWKMDTRQPIAINVCPSILMMTEPGKKEPSLFSELIGLRDRVILELTERFNIQNYEKLFETIDFYRRNGFRIAIDDLGAGFTRLRLLSQIQPAIIKVDRFLISDIHKSTQKQMLLESIVSFCRKISALVVAEGIETESELDVIMHLKVDLAQGYFLCPPVADFSGCLPAAASCIHEANNKAMMPQTNMSCNAVGSLINTVCGIGSSVLVESAIKRFQQEDKISALPVVDNQRPVGIIQKDKMFYKLGQPHGYALFGNKPVKKIMGNALVFESHTPLEEVARTVLKRNENSVYDAVIVTKNGAYAGIVEIYQLLHGITEQKVQLAIQANPLTGLPGNNLIREEIVNRLNQNRIFAVLYFDLDNFKPYNDNFGFHRGDQAIRFLADLIKKTVGQWDETGGFVGHVGGDDFVAVCRAAQVACLCQTIIRRFDCGIRKFHDNISVGRGYYTSMDRQGREARYPLLTVSIAVLTTGNRRFESYAHLVSVASEIKKKVKNADGSSFYIDQRLE